jgi:hypothetical protein
VGKIEATFVHVHDRAGGEKVATAEHAEATGRAYLSAGTGSRSLSFAWVI